MSSTLPLIPGEATSEVVAKIKRDASKEAPIFAVTPSRTKMVKYWERQKRDQRATLLKAKAKGRENRQCTDK